MIDKASFKTHGDVYEIEFGHLVTEQFPNIEKLWQVLVFPMTRRLESGAREKALRIRQGVYEELGEVASQHYSILMHLVYAHWHYAQQSFPLIENIYTHLATVCDLVESLVISWHKISLRCRGQQSRILTEWPREEFMERLGQWYDENYPDEFNNYVAKGKPISIKRPYVHDLLKEYFGTYAPRRDFAKFSNYIRPYRNAVVHDVVLMRLSTDRGILIPKLQKIGGYRRWKAVQDVADKPEIIERDFEAINSQILGAIIGLETILDRLWDYLIADVREELFSTERGVLREMLAIEFDESLETFSISVSEDTSNVELGSLTSSGVLPATTASNTEDTGGSALYLVSDEQDSG